MKERQLKEFRDELLAWFAQFQRHLPWRRSHDPYRVWVSEIMLQQTRVAAVIPYYERFLERFPNVLALASASEDEVLRMWSGLGYYSRARNLRLAAKQMVTKHGGQFPRTQAEALELAGIGRYTAGAILSIAFQEKLAVLDGNVARVIARLDAVRGHVRQGTRWQALQKRADELLATDAPGDWNQAMMELGATLCTPRAPRCLLCPVQRFCRARELGVADKLPERRTKRAAVDVKLAVIVFLDESGRSILLPPPAAGDKTQRDDPVPSLVAKLWHFPTLRLKQSPEAEVQEFLAQELAVRAHKGAIEVLEKIRHTVTYRRIEVAPLLVPVRTLPRILAAKPMPPAAILSQPISNLTRKVAKAALKRLSGRTKAEGPE